MWIKFALKNMSRTLFQKTIPTEAVNSEENLHPISLDDPKVRIIQPPPSATLSATNKPSGVLPTTSRVPFRCPVTTCGRTMGVTEVLSHFVTEHKSQTPIEILAVQEKQRSVLVLEPSSLRHGENLCLGILMYGGHGPTSRPAASGICLSGCSLPTSYQRFELHLPVLIMASRTHLSALLPDHELARELYRKDEPEKDITVFWLATMETSKPIYTTLTAFDQKMNVSRSSIVRVRCLAESQDPLEFLAKSSDYLMLNEGSIRALSKKYKAPIELEISLHEYDV